MLKFEARFNLGSSVVGETATALGLNTKEKATQCLKRLGRSG
jgi:hypothetical protein